MERGVPEHFANTVGHRVQVDIDTLIPEDLNIIVTPPPIRGGEYKVQIMNKVLAEAQFTVGSLGLRSIQQLFP